MAIETEITTNKDERDHKPWTATIKTDEYGTWYGYGDTEREAIKDAEQELNFWTTPPRNSDG